MDKATLRARCNTALQSLPDAEYRAMLARLFDDLLAAQPQAVVPAPGDAQAELVVAIHTLASHFENTLYALRDDAEALAKAKGDIAHALKIAAKYNRNGVAVQLTAQAERAPAQAVQEGEYPPLPTDGQVIALEVNADAAAVHGAMPVNQQWPAICNLVRRAIVADRAARVSHAQAEPKYVKFICVDCTGCPKCRTYAAPSPEKTARMLTPEEPEKCYSLDEETFYDLGELINMLDEEQAKPGFLVYEGESVRHAASHYARGAVDDLFERMGEQAFDDAGEHIGDWPDHAVKDDNSEELEKLIYDWLDANVRVRFYTVKNVRQIALTADMLGDDDAGRTIPASGEVGGE